jgi:hypothetical protein
MHDAIMSQKLKMAEIRSLKITPEATLIAVNQTCGYSDCQSVLYVALQCIVGFRQYASEEES